MELIINASSLEDQKDLIQLLLREIRVEGHDSDKKQGRTTGSFINEPPRNKLTGYPMESRMRSKLRGIYPKRLKS